MLRIFYVECFGEGPMGEGWCEWLGFVERPRSMTEI